MLLTTQNISTCLVRVLQSVVQYLLVQGTTNGSIPNALQRDSALWDIHFLLMYLLMALLFFYGILDDLSFNVNYILVPIVRVYSCVRWMPSFTFGQAPPAVDLVKEKQASTDGCIHGENFVFHFILFYHVRYSKCVRIESPVFLNWIVYWAPYCILVQASPKLGLKEKRMKTDAQLERKVIFISPPSGKERHQNSRKSPNDENASDRQQKK